MLVIRKDNIARGGNVDYVGIGSDGDADVSHVFFFACWWYEDNIARYGDVSIDIDVDFDVDDVHSAFPLMMLLLVMLMLMLSTLCFRLHGAELSFTPSFLNPESLSQDSE